MYECTRETIKGLWPGRYKEWIFKALGEGELASFRFERFVIDCERQVECSEE